MSSPQTPKKSIFNNNPASRNNLMKLVAGGANARTLGYVNNRRIKPLPSRQNMINRGPGGAPVKRPPAGRRTPNNMTRRQTISAVRGLFNAAGAFGN